MNTNTKSKIRPLKGEKKTIKPRGGLAAELAAAKSKLTPAAVVRNPEQKAAPAINSTAEPSKANARYEFMKKQFDGSRCKSQIAKNLMAFNAMEDTEDNFRKCRANVNNFPSNHHPDGFKSQWAPEPKKEKEIKKV